MGGTGAGEKEEIQKTLNYKNVSVPVTTATYSTQLW